MRKRLTSVARCAIKMQGKEQDETNDMHAHLINGPYHCFRYHSNCSTDFYEAAGSTHADTSSNPSVENEVQQKVQVTMTKWHVCTVKPLNSGYIWGMGCVLQENGFICGMGCVLPEAEFGHTG